MRAVPRRSCHVVAMKVAQGPRNRLHVPVQNVEFGKGVLGRQGSGGGQHVLAEFDALCPAIRTEKARSVAARGRRDAGRSPTLPAAQDGFERVTLREMCPDGLDLDGQVRVAAIAAARQLGERAHAVLRSCSVLQFLMVSDRDLDLNLDAVQREIAHMRASIEANVRAQRALRCTCARG